MNTDKQGWQPLVSVIIATCNRAEYLKVAIDSVLTQTYSNFELLILDNFSTDHTGEVIASYTDSRIKSIRHLANIGPIANWYYGMHWAAGEYFSILGDDDYYLPNFIEQRVKAFQRHPEVLIVFSDHDECDALGVILPKTTVFSYSESKVISGEELLRALDNGNRIFQVGSGLQKKEPVVSWWNECVHAGLAFDTAIHVQVACRGAAAVIPDRGLVYRRHSNQACASGNMRMILIGYTNAYLEPILYQKTTQYSDELVNGLLWSLSGLIRHAVHENDLHQARRLCRLGLVVAPFRFNLWLRLMVASLPLSVVKSLRGIKRRLLIR